MPASQNGWSANDRSVIETYIVGKGMRVPLRKGDAGFLLKHVADWFDVNIKDIDGNYKNGELDDWGYAERPIRGGVQLSNHASGTAIDVNATNWPLGVEPSSYLTADQIRRLREHLKIYEGVIRWGGDYSGRKDPMHFEIDDGAAEVARIAAKIRQTGDDDMPSAEEVARAVWNFPVGKVGDGPASVGPANAVLFLQHIAYHATNASNGAGALAPQIVAELVKSLPAAQLEEIAKVVNDEADRRNRDNDPTTGTKS